MVEYGSHVYDGAIFIKGFFGQASVLVTNVSQYEKKNYLVWDIQKDVWSVVLG